MSDQPYFEPPPPYKPLPTTPPAFEPPPPYGSKPAPPPRTSQPTRLSRGRVISGTAAALIAAGAVVSYFLFSSGTSATAKTPQAAVRKLLDAGKRNDVKTARALLCSEDQAIGAVSHLQSSGTITSYTIGAQTTQNGVTFVDATFATSKSAGPSTEKFPVVKEGSSWRVCFSRELAALPGAFPSQLGSDFPLPTVGGTEVPGFPTTGANSPAAPVSTTATLPTNALCRPNQTSGFGVASTYVGAAEIGVAQVAQACVYQSQVPIAVAQRLNGKLFGPTTTDQNAAVIMFQSTDRSITVTVTTAKESDGLYYVTAVTIN